MQIRKVAGTALKLFYRFRQSVDRMNAMEKTDLSESQKETLKSPHGPWPWYVLIPAGLALTGLFPWLMVVLAFYRRGEKRTAALISVTHLILFILLGWACFPAILIGLLLQSLIFGFGGLTVLGVNTANMAVPAIIVYLIFNRFVKGNRKVITIICSALAGVVGVLLASLFTAFSLFFSGEEYINIAKIVVVGHLPLMAIEGVVNVSIIMLLRKVKPEVLEVSHAVCERG